MDKRYKTLTLPEQVVLRRQAIEDVLAHPEWTLPEAVRHLKKTMRLTTAENTHDALERLRQANELLAWRL